MNKTIFFLFSLIFIVTIFGCQKKMTKKVIPLQESNFYSNEKALNNDSILIQLSNAFDKVFKLSAIEKSTFKNEVRIYFINPFFERFFIEKQSDDSIHTRLYNCKTNRKRNNTLKMKDNDSLFMQIGGLITLDFKGPTEPFIYFDSIPTFKNFYTADTIGNVLDDGSTYFYEFKKGSMIKKGLIDKPLETGNNNFDAIYVVKFIRYINDKYTFHFWDTWINIVSSFNLREK